MVLVVTILGVVVAHHIDSLGIFGLVAHHHTCKGTGDGTAGIDAAHTGGEALGNLSDALGIGTRRIVATEHRLVDGRVLAIEDGMRIGIVGIIDLVADAPKEDAGVIAVAAHHIGHIAVDPLLEEVVGAVERWGADVPALDPLALGEFPFVGSLVHHEQTKFVAKVIEDGRLRIVGATDGIHTNLLEVLEATTPHIVGHGSTERAGIVMQTDALDLHPAAIERKALVGIELQGTQPDVDLIAVDGLIAFQERGAQQVEIGIVEVPAMRTRHIQAQLVGSLGANHLLSHHTTIGIEQLDVQLQAAHTLRIVDGNINIDLGRSIGEL